MDLDDTLYSFHEIQPIAIECMAEKASELLRIEKESFIKFYQTGRQIVKDNMKGNQASQHNRLLYCQKALEEMGINPLIIAPELSDIFWKTIFQEMKIRKGVSDFLQYVRSKGVKTAICTDMTADIQFRKIKQLELCSYIDALVTSEETGAEKPDASMFTTCLHKMNLTASQCIYIGDSLDKDVEGARKVGFRTVIRYCSDVGEQFTQKKGYWETGSFLSVLKYIKGQEL